MDEIREDGEKRSRDEILLRRVDLSPSVTYGDSSPYPSDRGSLIIGRAQNDGYVRFGTQNDSLV